MSNSDAEKIRSNICPVCNVQRTGTVDARRALKKHLKTVQAKDHRLWCAEHYDTHFKHGGDNVTKPVTREYILVAITKTFGEEGHKLVA